MEYNVSYRNKDKSIQAIISYKVGDDWKQKSKQGFKTQKAAKPWIDNALRELEEKLNLNLSEEYKGITFKQFADIYIKYIENHKEPNTVISYKSLLKKFSKLDNMILEDIQFMHIQDCINGLIKEDLSPTTIKDYAGKLKSVFNVAVKPYKIITTNPITEGLQIPKSKENKKIKVLNKFELDDLLIKLSGKDYIISLIAATCGLRIGEIIGLTWNNIDLNNGKIHIKTQWKQLKDNTWGFGPLKSKNSYRTVPIPPKTMQALKLYKINSVIDLVNNRLFLDYRTKSTVVRLIPKYRKLGFKISVHDLRHTYATMLIASGIDFKTAAQFLGHNVEMTMNIYSHVNQDMIDNATNKINAIF